MDLLLEIINNVDKQIKNKRLYLSKEHRNGIFNFQEFHDKYLPYHVDREKKLAPILDEFRNKINRIDNTKFNNLKIYDYYSFVENYLIDGIIAKTLLIDNDGNIVLTNYYKNIEPENYIGRIKVPESEQLKTGNFLYEISEGRVNQNKDNIEIEIKTHFNETIRKLFKEKNNNYSSRIFSVQLEKERKPILLSDVLFNLKVIVERLDDTCFNIFTRVDRLNYLLKNKQEIKTLMQESFSNKDKDEFNIFYKEQKDWFYLLSEAIDLTRNKYYKDKVDEKLMKNQTEELNELIQFISYSLYLNSEKTHKQKLKI